MKRIFLYLMIALTVMNAAGCATVQKKFTRKKEPKRIPSVIYLQEGPYQKKYSNAYYYKFHFTLWKSWQDELLLQWRGNNKKVARCAEEAAGHLTEMARYLDPIAQKRLEPAIESLRGIKDELKSGSYTRAWKSGMRSELERIKRTVSANFYYDKVRDSVLPDKVNLDAEPPAPGV